MTTTTTTTTTIAGGARSVRIYDGIRRANGFRGARSRAEEEEEDRRKPRKVLSEREKRQSFCCCSDGCFSVRVVWRNDNHTTQWTPTNTFVWSSAGQRHVCSSKPHHRGPKSITSKRLTRITTHWSENHHRYHPSAIVDVDRVY